MGSFPTVLGKEGKYHQEEDENKELRKREGGGGKARYSWQGAKWCPR